MMSARTTYFALFTIVAAPAAIPAALHADADDPPAITGRLHAMQGSVSLQPADVDLWTQPAENYTGATRDRLYSDQDSRAEIQLGSIAVRMWQNTDLTFTNLADQLRQLGLAQGSIRVRTFRSIREHRLKSTHPMARLPLLPKIRAAISCGLLSWLRRTPLHRILTG